MSEDTSIRDAFFVECEELLEALFEGLSEVEQGNHNDETVNSVFRAVHSIKGGAGAFGLEELVTFAHTYETVLDGVRSHGRELDQQLIDLVLRSADQLAILVDSSRENNHIDLSERDVLLKEMEDLLGDVDTNEDADFDFSPMSIEIETVVEDLQDGEDEVEIRFRPFPKLYKNGHDPELLFIALQQNCDVNISLCTDLLPELSDFSFDNCYFLWSVIIRGQDVDGVIEEVFDFVEGLCSLEIVRPKLDLEPVGGLVVEDTNAIKDHVSSDKDSGGQRESDDSMGMQSADNRKQSDSSKSGLSTTLRVDLDRVDRLINTVGELIINQAVLSQKIINLPKDRNSDIKPDIEVYKVLARELQESVMAIRAQPVKPLFQRMSRIVREASRSTGKQVNFVTHGETTEVDKTVVERLADPLTHMIRNAIDHGIEDSAVREKSGKSPIGEIRLAAFHRSGSVVIEVSDDGAGLNRERIKKTALEKGLVSDTSGFSDAEIDKLLFLPGFSTASAISNLSGRGVGMDVVKTAIQSLGGRVAISSVPGKGTNFTMILPLTLAVMDGMVVSVSSETMVLPISSILESIRATTSMVHSVAGAGSVLSIRGEYIPIIDVAQALSLPLSKHHASDQIFIIVEGSDEKPAALLVDQIFDQRQVVIKSMSGENESIPGVSAATILGDGKIALILDIDYLSSVKQVNVELQSKVPLDMVIENA